MAERPEGEDLSWTGAYDHDSFVAPLRKRRTDLEDALTRANNHAEAVALLDEIDELKRFVHAIKEIDGPSARLQPVSQANPTSGDLYVLEVGRWRGYFYLEPSARAYYAALVEHPSIPTTKRLDELRR